MMTRDEAVKKIAREGYISIERAEELYDSIVPKPVVPKYVADWYEEHKGIFEESLFTCIYYVEGKPPEKMLGKFKKWLINNEQALKTLINMHQYGYEVEKEPRYLVKVKGIDGCYAYLDKELRTSKWIFGTVDNFANHRTHHTRKELEEAGFEWVFDCEGIEIKEVE